jgi:membrane associated rhomboid family serine protease
MASIRNNLMSDFRMYVLHSGNALYQIIAINVGLFLVAGIIRLIDAMGVSGLGSILTYIELSSNPLEVLFKPWSVITFQFLHFDFFHILFNLLILSFIGRIFREFLGDAKLISVYVIGGLCGGLMYILCYQFLPMFANYKDNAMLLGASASIMALVGAAATLVPRYTVRLMFIGNVQLIYIALFYFVISLFSVVGSNAGGALSHIGGLLWGVIYIKALQNGQDYGKWVNDVLYFFKNLGGGKKQTKNSNLKVKYSYSDAMKEKGTAGEVKGYQNPFGSSQSTTTRHQTLQDEVDAILDKINKNGYDSLTQKEKDTLQRASKMD